MPLPVLRLTCPIDGLTLGNRTTTVVGDLTRDMAEIGGHLHLQAATITCNNGHQWRISDMVMERIA